jgi:colicin import membrane protein
MQLAEEIRQEEEAERQEQFRREEEARRREEEATQQLEERRRTAAAVEEQWSQDEAAHKQREAGEARRKAEADARAARDREVADYVARIRAKIQGRVVIPPNLRGNPQVVYEVTLLPGGDVLQAVLKRGSGAPAYDAAVERAIMAAQPLPVPSDPRLFRNSFRILELKFRPKE